MGMKLMPKSRFKPKAFEYFRLVEQGESIIITDHGRPVAKIVPYSEEHGDAIGSLRGTLVAYQDPLEPVGETDWEAG